MIEAKALTPASDRAAVELRVRGTQVAFLCWSAFPGSPGSIAWTAFN